MDIAQIARSSRGNRPSAPKYLPATNAERSGATTRTAIAREAAFNLSTVLSTRVRNPVDSLPQANPAVEPSQLLTRRARDDHAAAVTKRASAASSAKASMDLCPVRHWRKFPNAHVAPLRAVGG